LENEVRTLRAEHQNKINNLTKEKVEWEKEKVQFEKSRKSAEDLLKERKVDYERLCDLNKKLTEENSALNTKLQEKIQQLDTIHQVLGINKNNNNNNNANSTSSSSSSSTAGVKRPLSPSPSPASSSSSSVLPNDNKKFKAESSSHASSSTHSPALPNGDVDVDDDQATQVVSAPFSPVVAARSPAASPQLPPLHSAASPVAKPKTSVLSPAHNSSSSSSSLSSYSELFSVGCHSSSLIPLSLVWLGSNASVDGTSTNTTNSRSSDRLVVGFKNAIIQIWTLQNQLCVQSFQGQQNQMNGPHFKLEEPTTN